MIFLFAQQGATNTVFIQGLILCLLPALAGAQEHETLPRGHVFFATDFEGSEALKGWSGPGVLGEGFQGGHALILERPAEKGSGYATATLTLPVEKMRGYVVQFSARIKAENVSRKPQPWNGVKFMAPVVTDQEKTWPAAELPVGTFGWQKVAFRAVIPEDAKQVNLVVGLEAVTGKAWFDDIRVIAWKPLTAPGPQVASGKPYKGYDLPRLRGAMVSPDIDAEGLRVLGQQWNANLVRWQLVRREKFTDPLDLAAYERWLQSALKQLDAALPLCEKYGLRVVVDLHSPPGGHRLSGGYAGSDHGLFTDAACQRKFVEVWQHMAKRYKDARAIWGYDLANEPVEAVAGEDLADWQDLAERAAKVIRAIDAQRAIIVEPPEWGNPQGLRQLQPLAVPNVVYSVHMYLPHAFTHQGVHGPGKAYRYPGEIDGKRWDKAQLEAGVKPVVEFQRKYNVHIYIGEFSAIRWAPDGSACRYLKDLIDIFEAHGWDWSYHAFREWDGWSVEHGSDPKDHRRATSPTDREQLLRSWFAQNVKAGGKSAVPPAPAYPDGRPAAKHRLDAQDHGIVLRHGDGPGGCDILGARDVWVFEAAGTYYIHYDAAGPKGWLAALATSKDLLHWQKRGPVLELGKAGENDSASASYGTTFYDGRNWHMFYLGTPHTSPAPDLVPAFPYLTMKAKSTSPAGPWSKQKDVIPFQAKPGTYYSVTASPGQIVKQRDEYLMFFSAAVDHPIRRTLGIARTKSLDSPWALDPKPILPAAEQVENSSLYFEPANRTWFLFTNHVGLDGFEYTDAVWVYWNKDLNRWDPAHKAVVLDRHNCSWSKHIIGLPSVLRVGDRLALLYDGNADTKMSVGVKSHMNRDIGLAWLRLPLVPPAEAR